MIRRLPVALTLLALAAGTPALAQDAASGAAPAHAATKAAAIPAPHAAPPDLGEMAPPAEPSYETATVQAVVAGGLPGEHHITLDLTSGPRTGTRVELDQRTEGPTGLSWKLAPGDEVVAVALPDPGDPNAPPQYQVADHQRAKPVSWLLGLVAALLLLIGGRRGFKTLGVLALTIAAIGGLLVPLTLQGWNPTPLAIAFSTGIALVTTLLTAGPGRKAWAAVIGTVGAVSVSLVLAALSASFAHLSGVVGDEGLGSMGMRGIDFQGLLAAGMVLGALGLMLDLALSISASVDELAEANPGLGRGLLFQAGLQVGRDMLSTSSNTLLLAYMGGFLPVLLTYGAQGVAGARMLNQEGLATEAVTLAVGLAGLLVALPLTAAVATLLQPVARPAPFD